MVSAKPQDKLYISLKEMTHNTITLSNIKRSFYLGFFEIRPGTMFSQRLTFPSYRGFLSICWLVVLLIIKLSECSQDRKRVQQALKNHTKDYHHLKEHLVEQMGMDEETAIKYLNETSSEVQFFLMHDYDNNSKLDGLELLQSLSHHKHSKDEGQERSSTFIEDELASFVDTIMEDQDHNDDGYIDYPEFVSSLSHQPGHTKGTE